MQNTTAAKYTVGQIVTLTQARSGSHRAKGAVTRKRMEVFEVAWSEAFVIDGTVLREEGWTYRLRTPGSKTKGRVRYAETDLSD